MVPHPRITGPHKLRVLQGTPEWLEARRTHVTATDLPVILGLSPWRCEQDLADEKLSGNGVESTLVMRVGSALEDLIAEDYAEQTGLRVRRVRGLWESRTLPWAAASPDATARGRLVELKWTGSRARFRDGLPEDVEAQVRWQLFVAEVPEADVAALTVGEPHARIFTVTRDEEIERNLVIAAADFRRRLAAGGPFDQSLDSLKRKYPADDGTEMVADAELDAAVRALKALRDRRQAAEESERVLEAAIKTRMAAATRLVGDGWAVTWKRARDTEVTDWKSVADGLLRQLPEPDRAAVVGVHTTVREGARYFRVAWGKEDAS